MSSKIQQFCRLTALNGYKPSQSIGGPDADPNTIYRGQNFWIRAGGRLKPIKGILQRSTQNLGTRIYPLDQYRGEIAGGLVSSRLPKESLVRYQNSALFFVSENISQQVYINESTSSPYTLTSVTTSSTAGKLRVALLSGMTYTARDVGLDAPPSIGTVSTEVNGSKSMNGKVSVRSAARRRATDSTGNPTEASVQTLTATGSNRIRIVLPAMATGQDGWIFGGTEWNEGDYGPWKVIREIETSFTVGATNGSSTVSGSNISRTLRPGDRLTLNGTQYYVGAAANSPTLTQFTICSDAAGTVLVNFPGATNNYTLTINELVLDWRDGELGEPLAFDNDPPPVMDGIMLFNDVPFGWKDNVILPSKIGNPEAYPTKLQRSTQSGSNIIHALAGNGRIYLMTTNGLEIVTFTQLEEDPFLIRQIWAFGFQSPAHGIVVEGSFFGAIGTSSGVKIVRTREDESPDLQFSADVEEDMLNWNIANVVLGFDPTNAAFLVFHNNGTDTTVIPYMLQLGRWSVPHIYTAVQVKTAATVSSACELIAYNGTNFREYQFEGNNGIGINKYAVWPFLDLPVDSFRKVIKRIKITDDFCQNAYMYVAPPGQTVPPVLPSVGGTNMLGPFPLASAQLNHESVINTNIQNPQSYAFRIDSNSTAMEVQEVSIYGIINEVWR